MGTHNFDEIVKRYNTESRKWDNIGEVFGDTSVLPLWIADMDFASPPAVLKAIQAKAAHGVFGYPARRTSLHESVMRWAKVRHHWTLKSEWISTAPGVVSSISAAVLALTEPGDSIIIQPPVYPPFFSCVRNNGRKIVENALKNNHGYYEFAFADLEAKIDDTVRMIVLCSPHNPVGRVWREEELCRLADICLKHQIIILADEIHHDLVFSGHKHTPLASLSPEIAHATVTFMAASKTFNVAGLNTSFIITPDPVKRKKINKLLHNLEIGKTTIFGGAAAEAAYTDGEEWLEELLVYLENNADYIVSYAEQHLPGVKVIKPEGTYLAWLDFRDIFSQSDQLSNFLTKEAKVGLNDGLSFGCQGEGFARLNFGCPRSIIQEALQRIERAIKNLQR
ncbi:aminotransferase [Sporomusaceae bacterium FL31]|nr:aminotransferase [Sporomusaceae bacterium FL31]GCE32294.1 aminotransferase [Sporomusaceae bacterium]